MIRSKLLAVASALALSAAADDFSLHYSGTFQANGGPNDFAPYYIGSLRHGTAVTSRGAMLDAAVWHPLDLSRRFSYAFGVEALARLDNSVGYERFNVADAAWYTRDVAPSRAVLQQLWGEVKYRGVYLRAGQRDFTPALVNQRLSSGDLVESGNSRNLPAVRAGFVDFQNIPFTRGWVQIQGEIAYGKALDNGWQKSHYNYYNEHINLGWWYNYKRCFFRTKPSQPLSITVGMQAAAQFAGETYCYRSGKIWRYDNMKLQAKDFLDMLILRQGDEYWKGNHVGSWDFQARYRLPDRSEVKAYFQWLWEDGSGIGKLNGADGLWGVEWKAARPGIVSGAVIELLTFMNHSGPIHYDPADHPGHELTQWQATGRDDYYNNFWYNGYALYGMAIGSPMFISPVYNTDGATTTFLHNRFWGIHGALEGEILPGQLSYRAMASYRRFFGRLQVPAVSVSHDFSAMVEASWKLPRVPGLTFTAQIALDYGNSAYGKNFGTLIGLTYSGVFNFKNSK